MCKDALRKHIRPNTSGGQVILSISESILLAIDAYKKAKVGTSSLLKLYMLYIEGVKTVVDQTLISQINKVLTAKNYTVSADPRTINEDPTKRFFETYLAYYLLKNNAAELDHQELEQFTTNIKNRLLALPEKEDSHTKLKVENILEGNVKEKKLTKYEKEYAELIAQLTKNKFYKLPAKACKNLLQIAAGVSFSTLNTQVDSSMPVDIYADSVFTMGMDGRGRINKKGNDNVKTTAKGLMKSTTPLYRYGNLVNRVHKKYGDKKQYSPFQRSVDQSGYRIENYWVHRLFSLQTQVYSNGVSSTTLAQIRNMILEKRLGHSYCKGFFQKHMTVFASLMVYNSGGHSFYEVFEVLKMRLCRELIGDDPTILEAIEHDILMYTWLYVDQPEAFEKAMGSTLKYMDAILSQKILNAQFKTKYMTENVESGAQITLHRALVNSSIQEFEELLRTSTPETVDSLDYNEWPALMVAAQLGKTEHVKKLLAAGAAVNKQAQDFSALDVAIKWEHYETVLELLGAGAQVVRNQIEGGGIKKNAPALYFACRQNDVRIVRALLEHEQLLNIEDKKEAALVALRIENLDALQLLVEHIKKEVSDKSFIAKYKSELLKEAVCLGSTDLIEFIMKLDIYPEGDQLDHQLLLDTAVEKGFLPTVHLLLDSQRLINESSREHRNQPAEEAQEKKGVGNTLISDGGCNISMMIISSFIASVGIAAVAIAFTVLNAVTFGTAGLVIAGLGVAAVLSSVGLFAFGPYKRQPTPEDSWAFECNPVH
jgi:hypothetical protein